MLVIGRWARNGEMKRELTIRNRFLPTWSNTGKELAIVAQKRRNGQMQYWIEIIKKDLGRWKTTTIKGSISQETPEEASWSLDDRSLVAVIGGEIRFFDLVKHRATSVLLNPKPGGVIWWDEESRLIYPALWNGEPYETVGKLQNGKSRKYGVLERVYRNIERLHGTGFVLSPDRRHVLFTSDRDKNGSVKLGSETETSSELYVVNTRNARAVRVTITKADEHYPNWSPNGLTVGVITTSSDEPDSVVLYDSETWARRAVVRPF
jgi:Tol biopolymer transport system component